ncbi:MAG: imidazole glycerol phosphate synthase cyclase subunit [bacterium]
MKKKRLIPILLLRNGSLVQSIDFSEYLILGNPVEAVKRLSEWAADEIIYLDISGGEKFDAGRSDLGNAFKRTFREVIVDVADATFMPMTVGGKIRNRTDIAERLSQGADKVSLNTIAFDNFRMVEEAVLEFGSQCIVASIDYKEIDGKLRAMVDGGTRDTGLSPQSWSKRLEEIGVGEILLNCIDRDGKKNGYDIETISEISADLKIPVIALGGVGNWEHFREALEKTDVDAVAAANIFQHTDQSVYHAKKYLFDSGLSVREPMLLSI